MLYNRVKYFTHKILRHIIFHSQFSFHIYFENNLKESFILVNTKGKKKLTFSDMNLFLHIPLKVI